MIKVDVRYDARIWCRVCSAVIGTVEDLPDNDPRDRVVRAMQQHTSEAVGVHIAKQMQAE